MDTLERFLKFDDWTNRQVLDICKKCTTEQLNQRFDIGHETIVRTFSHMIWNMEVWTGLIMGGDLPVKKDLNTIVFIVKQYGEISSRFAEVALNLAACTRLDELYVDFLDNPPTKKSYGGTITHVLTHNMVHRSEILHMLKRLGVGDIIEGDVLSWESGRLG